MKYSEFKREVERLGFTHSKRCEKVADLPFEFTYLNKDVETGEYSISDDRDCNGIKTIFTESEVAEMDIAGFEKVEVTPE